VAEARGIKRGARREELANDHEHLESGQRIYKQPSEEAEEQEEEEEEDKEMRERKVVHGDSRRLSM
jgi:hypothetical protein